MNKRQKQLLREWEPLKVESGFIIESRENNCGRLFLRGPMQRADAPNHNGRIYPRALLKREFDNYMKLVREKRAVGELDHPDETVVALTKVSHAVREQYWEGDTWFGRIEIIPTPNGKIAETLIDSGVTLGISSRGVGSTETNASGISIVQDDFTLLCFDLVQEPSTHGAFMALSEGKQVQAHQTTRADRIYRALNNLRKV
jgi:hypothetical protein